MSDRWDKAIKDSLKQGTEDATELKDEVWERIRNELQQGSGVGNKQAATDPGRRRRNGKPRRIRWISSTVGLTAMLLLGLFFTTAAPGQALVAQVKEWFAPQKAVKEELEGIPFEAEVELQEGNTGYVIYFDEEMYRMVLGEETDRIVPNRDPGDLYPEVYMEIGRQDDSPDEVADALYQSMVGTVSTLLEPRVVEEPYPGWEIYAVSGTGGKEWNDPVTRYYVWSDEAGGSFVIRQQYFIEAEEGHGDRFQQMLKEFYITEKE